MVLPTTSSSIQQRGKVHKSQPSHPAAQPLSPEYDQSNGKRRLRHELYHTFLTYWNNYYYMTSPIGKLRSLFVTMILCTILGILLFHPPCYRHRARGMPLCRISREMGLIPQLPQKKSSSSSSSSSNKKQEELPPQERTRLLLGFMTTGNDEQEKQRRESIRTTLLSYAKGSGVGSVGEDHYGHVCCLADYLDSPDDYRYCQVVYTFLQGGNSDGTHLDFNSTYRSLLQYDQTSIFEEQRRQKQTKDGNVKNLLLFEEPDVTFLNVQDSNTVRKVFAWYDYSTKLRMEPGRKFDYVAFSDTDHSLDVPKFLNNNIFQKQSVVPMTYGGINVARSQCDQQIRAKGHACTEACSHLTNTRFMTNMVLLSHDLVQYSLSHNNLIQLGGLYPQDCPEIAIANLLRYEALKGAHLKGIIKSSS